MSLEKITVRPGINTMATQLANEGGWSLANLVRFRQGFAEKVGGWLKLFAQAVSDKTRALHAYEDLAANKNLVIGGDAGLQIYVTGPSFTTPILANTQLARRTDTALYTGAALGTISGTAGSPNVTVLDSGHGAKAGDQVALPVTISVGGLIILPQTVTVSSVTPNTWIFVNSSNLVTNANASGLFGTTPIFSITAAEVNTATCRVTLPAHGLAVSSTFQVQFAVVWQSFPGGVSVPAGNYIVASVIDANTFTITTPDLTQTALAFGAEAGFDLAQPAGTITGLWGLVYYLASNPISPDGNWFLDNLGGTVIIGLGNGGLYQFIPPVSSSGGPTSAQIIANAPLINAGMFVAMSQAQIVTFGSESVIGSGVQDPLMIRWCDAGNQTVWIAGATNQAGSFRLSKGSQIIGGTQAPQAGLIWTDTHLWSMSYIQPPLVYSIVIIGSGCGLIAAKAFATLGRTTYWMSQKGFWSFGDQGVQPIECPVWDTVFNNITLPQPQFSKIFAGANEAFNEVIWYYPSMNSSGGECDSYVKWKIELGPNGWDYGTLSRTAWLGVSIFGMPVAADPTLHIMQHETGFDNDTAAMTGAYIETGFFSIGNGDAMPYIKEMLPDIKWFGSGGALTFTLWSQDYSDDTIYMHGPWTVTRTTQIIEPEVRARQIALRVDWAPIAGFSARLGAIRARIAPAGRAP
jgi:hypothetical protein